MCESMHQLLSTNILMHGSEPIINNSNKCLLRAWVVACL